MNIAGSYQSMFKIPELKRRITFTLLMLLIYRIGSHVPTPGIDGRRFRHAGPWPPYEALERDGSAEPELHPPAVVPEPVEGVSPALLAHARESGRPDGFQKRHRVLGRLSHRVLEPPMGVGPIAQELGALDPEREDLRDDGVVVVGVGVVAARIVGAPDLLAQTALRAQVNLRVRPLGPKVQTVCIEAAARHGAYGIQSRPTRGQP